MTTLADITAAARVYAAQLKVVHQWTDMDGTGTMADPPPDWPKVHEAEDRFNAVAGPEVVLALVQVVKSAQAMRKGCTWVPTSAEDDLFGEVAKLTKLLENA
jgi:hypothetical protein